MKSNSGDSPFQLLANESQIFVVLERLEKDSTDTFAMIMIDNVLLKHGFKGIGEKACMKGSECIT
jgi:hypothetical protein